MEELDWKEAEEYLNECLECVKADVGLFGYLSLLMERFDSGERTQELFNEIMEISL